MGKIIFTIIFTFFFAKVMAILFDDDYEGFSKKKIVKYIVKQEEGAVACATEEIYKNVQNLYNLKNFQAIQQEISNKNCIILDKGDELEAFEGICNVVDKNSVKLFKSKKVFLQKIYIPCFAVEEQKAKETKIETK